MKNSFLSLCFVIGTSVTVSAQQWTGSSNINGNLYRNGNVGIGVSSPSQKLEVGGSIKVADDADIFGLDILEGFNDLRFKPTPQADVSMFLSSTGNLGVGMATAPTERLQVNGNIRVANDADIFGLDILEGFNDLRFRPAPGTDIAMFLSGSGNLGIGTTSPSAKLEVNGTIRTKEVKVEASPWPDYVFENGYDLKSLNEVKSFILENKHLPNIPSAQKVQEEGVSLGEMNAMLLQKIEELTLYLISQEEEISTLKSEIRNIKSNVVSK